MKRKFESIEDCQRDQVSKLKAMILEIESTLPQQFPPKDSHILIETDKIWLQCNKCDIPIKVFDGYDNKRGITCYKCDEEFCINCTNYVITKILNDRRESQNYCHDCMESVKCKKEEILFGERVYILDGLGFTCKRCNRFGLRKEDPDLNDVCIDCYNKSLK